MLHHDLHRGKIAKIQVGINGYNLVDLEIHQADVFFGTVKKSFLKEIDGYLAILVQGLDLFVRKPDLYTGGEFTAAT